MLLKKIFSKKDGNAPEINVCEKKEIEHMELLDVSDIEKIYDVSYGANGTENLMDLFIPKNHDGLIPTIVSVHGGAWKTCNKEQYRPYCFNLARRDFAVVDINYRLAPQSKFPDPEMDLNEVLTFIANHGKEYKLDRNNVFLVGDSAGAQIISHYMATFANKAFADKFDFVFPDVKIKALGLNCGVYNTREMLAQKNDMFLYYMGIKKKDITEEKLDLVDTLAYINAEYPPCFLVSAANDFALSELEPMYNILRENNVVSEMKVYGSKSQKDIGHIFHLNIKNDEAVMCNDDECKFLKRFIS